MPMKLKAGHVFGATLVVAQIIREKRPLPPKAAYRLARLHTKLEPEFKTLTARRDEMITAYDTHVVVKQKDPETGEESDVQTPDFCVPDDKLPEFTAAWGEIGSEEIEVGVEPMPIDCFGDTAMITAQEFIALGDLVTE